MMRAPTLPWYDGMMVEWRTLGRHVREDGVVAQAQSRRAQDVEVSRVDQLHITRNDMVSAPRNPTHTRAGPISLHITVPR
jgi:hypothetical protein